MTITYHVVDGSGKVWAIHWRYDKAQTARDELERKYPHLSFTIKEVEKAD